MPFFPDVKIASAKVGGTGRNLGFSQNPFDLYNRDRFSSAVSIYVEIEINRIDKYVQCVRNLHRRGGWERKRAPPPERLRGACTRDTYLK